MTMNSNKIWRGWATNFGNGDGVIPFFSHTPSLPESYETVLLSKADFDALLSIAALRERTWKPITEMSRDDMETGMNFILWSPKTHASPHEGRYWTQENEWCDTDGYVMKPTHFMPLPTPPQEEPAHE